MEPKYLAEEVIAHPNHHLTFGDWIPRVWLLTTIVLTSPGMILQVPRFRFLFSSAFVVAKKLKKTEQVMIFQPQWIREDSKGEIYIRYPPPDARTKAL